MKSIPRPISSVQIRTQIPPDLQTLSVQYRSEPRYHQIYKHYQFSTITYQNPDTTRYTNIISSVHIRTQIPPDLQTLSVQYISEPRNHQIYKHFQFHTDKNPDTTRSPNIISIYQNPDTTKSTNIISSVQKEPRYHQISKHHQFSTYQNPDTTRSTKHYQFSTDKNPDTTRSTMIISSVQTRTQIPPDPQILSVQYISEPDTTRSTNIISSVHIRTHIPPDL